jgi:hypothetical protein
MSPNHRLTNALKGRTIANFETEGDSLTLRFTDGTTMRIKGTLQGSTAVPQGGQVSQAFEQGDRLAPHLGNQISVVATLENPGNAVSVRNAESKVLCLGETKLERCLIARCDAHPGSRSCLARGHPRLA